jgi:hypothetical protein
MNTWEKTIQEQSKKLQQKKSENDEPCWHDELCWHRVRKTCKQVILPFLEISRITKVNQELKIPISNGVSISLIRGKGFVDIYYCINGERTFFGYINQHMRMSKNDRVYLSLEGIMVKIKENIIPLIYDKLCYLRNE